MTVEEFIRDYPDASTKVSSVTLRQWRRRGSVPLSVTKTLQSVTGKRDKTAGVTNATPESVTLSDGQVWMPDPEYADAPSRYPIPTDAPIPDILKSYPTDKARAYMRLGWCPLGYLTASHLSVRHG
jgi:hypothetical protein